MLACLWRPLPSLFYIFVRRALFVRKRKTVAPPMRCVMLNMRTQPLRRRP